MEIEKILNLNYMKDKDKKELHKALKQIKPLKKFEKEIPLESLESLVSYISLNYYIQPQWIFINAESAKKDAPSLYSLSIKETKDHQWLGSVHAVCLYELMAKLVVFMYDKIKSGEVEKK